MKMKKKSVISEVATERILEQNTAALKFYDNYRKVAELIERAEIAAGRRVVFKLDTGSTLNFEINLYGVFSTTAQTI